MTWQPHKDYQIFPVAPDTPLWKETAALQLCPEDIHEMQVMHPGRDWQELLESSMKSSVELYAARDLRTGKVCMVFGLGERKEYMVPWMLSDGSVGKRIPKSMMKVTRFMLRTWTLRYGKPLRNAGLKHNILWLEPVGCVLEEDGLGPCTIFTFNSQKGAS